MSLWHNPASACDEIRPDYIETGQVVHPINRIIFNDLIGFIRRFSPQLRTLKSPKAIFEWRRVVRPKSHPIQFLSQTFHNHDELKFNLMLTFSFSLCGPAFEVQRLNTVSKCDKLLTYAPLNLPAINATSLRLLA